VSCEADGESCTLDHCDGQGQCVFGQQAPAPCIPHDFAITKIDAPKLITLSAQRPTQTSLIKVQIQNHSPYEERIDTPEQLENLVTLSVTSLRSCVAPSPAVRPQIGKVFPILLRSKEKYIIPFAVTFSCLNDPQKGAGHEDYSYHATVHHEASDGKRDTYPLDNTCPRSALGVTPNPNGKLVDKGCGGKRIDKTLGAEVLTDIGTP
jgi:hypothetical protein